MVDLVFEVVVGLIDLLDVVLGHVLSGLMVDTLGVVVVVLRLLPLVKVGCLETAVPPCAVDHSRQLHRLAACTMGWSSRRECDGRGWGKEWEFIERGPRDLAERGLRAASGRLGPGARAGIEYAPRRRQGGSS